MSALLPEPTQASWVRWNKTKTKTEKKKPQKQKQRISLYCIFIEKSHFYFMKVLKMCRCFSEQFSSKQWISLDFSALKLHCLNTLTPKSLLKRWRCFLLHIFLIWRRHTSIVSESPWPQEGLKWMKKGKNFLDNISGLLEYTVSIQNRICMTVAKFTASYFQRCLLRHCVSFILIKLLNLDWHVFCIIVSHLGPVSPEKLF